MSSIPVMSPPSSRKSLVNRYSCFSFLCPYYCLAVLNSSLSNPLAFPRSAAFSTLPPDFSDHFLYFRRFLPGAVTLFFHPICLRAFTAPKESFHEGGRFFCAFPRLFPYLGSPVIISCLHSEVFSIPSFPQPPPLPAPFDLITVFLHGGGQNLNCVPFPPPNMFSPFFLIVQDDDPRRCPGIPFPHLPSRCAALAPSFRPSIGMRIITRLFPLSAPWTTKFPRFKNFGLSPQRAPHPLWSSAARASGLVLSFSPPFGQSSSASLETRASRKGPSWSPTLALLFCSPPHVLLLLR